MAPGYPCVIMLSVIYIAAAICTTIFTYDYFKKATIAVYIPLYIGAIIVTWFFNEETQTNLLENSKNLSLMNTSFGIAGGFSSIKNINDKVLPGFYPVLLGHLSQLENIIVPNVLPSNWVTLKTRIILPFIKDKIISEETDKIIPMETRIDIWLREN